MLVVALKLNYHRLKPVVFMSIDSKDDHDTILKIGNIVRHRAGADGSAVLPGARREAGGVMKVGIRAVLFDMDGTLADSEAQTSAWEEHKRREADDTLHQITPIRRCPRCRTCRFCCTA